MEITKTRAAAYVGSGVVVGGGFAALGAGLKSPKLVALGAATGIVAAGTQAAVEGTTGNGGLGWLVGTAGGAAAGALMLAGLATSVRPGLTPMAARGFGAAVGAAVGALAPVVAGVVLAQLKPDA